MNTIIYIVLGALVGLITGSLLALFFKNQADMKTKKTAEKEAERILQKAQAQSAKIDRESKKRAKDFEKRARRNAEDEIRKEKDQILKSKEELKRTEKNNRLNLDKKRDKIQELEVSIKEREEKIQIAQSKIQASKDRADEALKEYQIKLESIAGISKDQAKSELIQALEEETKTEFADKYVEIEEEARDKAERKAKRIISLAVSRYAGEYAAERTTSILALPSEDMKGKVIGKEGRNIRAFESMCGVDLIIDEVPDAVVISAFDPVRREVAKRALEKLFTDGRIHPSSIEGAVKLVKKDLQKSILADGEKAISELGLTKVHPEILKLIGSLKYRTSYSQNNYTHSIETGILAGMMAAEMNQNVKVARRAGLLHDIGKAMDHSIEGSHAVIGADFAKKYGEREAVCHAIRSHHEDEKPNSVIAHIVAAADALSSARPGARKSTQDAYVKRLEDLESIANSFDGVTRTFAMQAGREIRVLVDGGLVSDKQSVMLSRDIARKIEREMSYPGQIKVSVFRETRAVEHAK